MNVDFKISVFVLLLFSGSFGHAQISFETLIPGVYENRPWDVIQTSDSGYVICGEDGRNFGQWPAFSMTLIKTDQFGALQWTHLYGLSFENRGFSVQETTDGNLIACGLTWADTMAQVLLVKTKSSGEQIFLRSFAVCQLEATALCIQQCSDQGFILCGRATSHSGSPVAYSFLTKTNANGDTLWNRIYHTINSEGATSVLCLPDSGFALLSNDFTGITIIRELDSNGNIEWEKSYSSLCGFDFSRTDDHGYIISGKIFSGSFDRIGLLRTDQYGDSLWYKVYPEMADANSIDVTNTGGYLLGGTIWDTTCHLYLLRTNQYGDPVWSMKYGGSDRDYGAAVKVTYDSGFIFAGTTKKPGTDSIMAYLIKGNEDSTTFGIYEKRISDKMLDIYPNPSNGIINIRLIQPAKELFLEVRDIMGNCVYKERLIQESDIIRRRIPSLKNGIYLVIVNTPDYLQTERILINSREN